MTVSTTVNPEFQRDKIIDLGIRLTGILPLGQAARPELISVAADHLNLELDTLQAAGKVLRTVERVTLPLIANTSEYTLAADTLDLVSSANDNVGTIFSSSDNSETVVQALPRGEWMGLSSKTSTASRPSFCYVERGPLVKLVFWPVPDSAYYSFRYARTRYFFANDTGNLSPDLARTWTQFLVYSVAAAVAPTSSLGLDKVQYFDAKAKEIRNRCEMGDSEHGSITLSIGHSGRNW
jgi:hypothetical protein